MLSFLSMSMEMKVDTVFRKGLKPFPSASPIFGLQAQAAEIEGSLDATAGVYKNDEGKVVIPEVVKQAAREAVEEDSSYKYAAKGVKGLDKKIDDYFLGKETLAALKAAGVHHSTIPSSGGTGALRTIIETLNPDFPLLVQNPRWANYDNIHKLVRGSDSKEFKNKLHTFEFIDEDTGNFNTDAFEKALDKILISANSEGISILINFPCDNPCGLKNDDLVSSLNEILNKDKYKGKIINLIIDTAYNDFQDSDKEHKLGFLVDLFKANKHGNLNIALANSFSKSFAMYGLRAGATTLLSKNEAVGKNWKEYAAAVMRASFSHVNAFTQNVLKNILGDESRVAELRNMQKGMFSNIKTRISSFVSKMGELAGQTGAKLKNRVIKLSSKFKLIKPDGGYVGVIKAETPELAQKLQTNLIENEKVFMPKLGGQYLRVPYCGLNEPQLDRLAKALHKESDEFNLAV